MPKPQLKKIKEHLQFLVIERNPFTEPDHLEKTHLYITKQFEDLNFSVNQESAELFGNTSAKIQGMDFFKRLPFTPNLNLTTI